MMRIKNHDTVIVLTGKDKGKRGKVIEILPQKGKVRVQGVAIMTKHRKARRAGETAGIKKEEGYLDLSNVMPICSACDKPSRFTAKLLEQDKKVRACHRCDAVI
jgi:large subunit ribosomal protein L24